MNIEEYLSGIHKTRILSSKMKRIVRETLSSIEIEEILAGHFNAFDALLSIVDTEEGKMVCAEIIDYE
jgi:hypothetical protein